MGYMCEWLQFQWYWMVDYNDFKKWLYDGHKQRKTFYKYSDIKNYYITESQFKFIKNKLINESDILTDIKNFYGGSTEHIENIRGYIFPDGEVVNVREKSHEDIRKINSTLGVMKVLDMGVIRLEYNGITLTKEPTFKQKYILKKIVLLINKHYFFLKQYTFSDIFFLSKLSFDSLGERNIVNTEE